MKKIRLLTFHNAHNYGALLQCRALSAELTKYGECKLINYIGESINYGIISRYAGSKNKLKALLRYFPLKRRYIRMKKYIDSFEQTPLCNHETVKDLQLRDCLCVVGSDQVWACWKKYDPVYFFKDIKAKKKISYAASMGKSEIPIGLQNEIGHCLFDFSNISVREKSAANLLEKIYSIKPNIVIDPVFLQDKSFWSREASFIRTPPRYILTYFLDVPDNAREIVNAMKVRLEIPVISINSIYNGRKYGADKDIVDAGPKEFVWLFEHADFVLTSSFHGTAFSLVFEKQFYTIPHRTTSERMVDLLKSIGLEDRLITKVDNIEARPIEYDVIRNNISSKVKDSKQYLQFAIENK